MRIQFEVEPEKAEEIEKLKEALGARTRTDLFNYALTLLKWATKEQEKGRIITSMDEEKGTYKQIEIPIVKSFLGKSLGKNLEEQVD